MLKEFLVAVMSLAVGATQANDEIALGCDGQWYEGDPFGENEKKDQQYRRYIISESKRKVAYWNELREVQISVCDKTWLTCDIDFEPTEITASGKLNSQGSNLLKINRRSGFIEEVWFSKKGPTKFFMGYCTVVGIPTANTERNLF